MLDNLDAATNNSECKSPLQENGNSHSISQGYKRSRDESGELSESKCYSFPMQYTTAEVEQRLEEITEEMCDHSNEIAR